MFLRFSPKNFTRGLWGPKLHNNDYTGLLNFAELGRSFIQHSGKGRNPTAVRSFKVCQASGGN